MPKYLEDLPASTRVTSTWFDEYAEDVRKGKGMWLATRTFENPRQSGSAASSMNRSKRYGGTGENGEFVFASRNCTVFAALNV